MENFLKWNAIEWSLLSTSICVNIAHKAKFDAHVSIKNVLENSIQYKIDTKIKVVFKVSSTTSIFLFYLSLFL